MGDIVRTVGGFSWNVCQQVLDAFDKYETSQKVTAVTVAMAKGIIDNTSNRSQYLVSRTDNLHRLPQRRA